jgi:hypothetical protein
VAKVWGSWGRSNRPGRGRNAATASHGAGGRGGLLVGRGRVRLARAARGDGKGANRGRSRAVWSGARPGQVASPVYGPAIGRVQGGERLKKLSVAVL